MNRLELLDHAVAMTDHGNMYGILDFYRECKKQGVKPVLGIEAYITMQHIELMNKVIAADPNSAEAAQAKALIEQLKKG